MNMMIIIPTLIQTLTFGCDGGRKGGPDPGTGAGAEGLLEGSGLGHLEAGSRRIPETGGAARWATGGCDRAVVALSGPCR